MPRRKRSSWGSVTRLSTNRYRLRWWADGPDGRKRQVVKAYDSMTQAGRESLAGVAKGLATLPENRPGDSRDRLASRDVA